MLRQARPDLADRSTRSAALLARHLSPRPTTPCDLVVRFQQVCGPVMAKGIEDTTFYRFNRFLALNEVGGDPDTLMHPSISALHDWADRAGRGAPARHDGAVDPRHQARRGRPRATAGRRRRHRRAGSSLWSLVQAAAERIGVDAPTAYFVFQTVLGAWPIDAERLDGYLTKAVREAKQRTTWTEPDEAYEAKVRCSWPMPASSPVRSPTA